MGAVVVILFFVVLIVGRLMYGNWLKNGMRPRKFTTQLSPDVVRGVFQEKVAGHSWKIVDDGNPMIAQSSLMTGIRQQISLHVDQQDEGSLVRIGVDRWVTKWGVPKKAHTLRLRMNSFEQELRRRDSRVAVKG